MHLSILFSLVGDYIQNANIGSRKEAEYSETNQEHVFEKDPVKAPKTIRSVPESDGFDNSWEDKSKERETHSADQRDKRTEIGNSDGYAQC